jgi:hypothetical protein
MVSWSDWPACEHKAKIFGTKAMHPKRDKWKERRKAGLQWHRATIPILGYLPQNARLYPGSAVHAYNPSFSGGRGRRINSLRPAWVKLVRLYLKSKIENQKG